MLRDFGYNLIGRTLGKKVYQHKGYGKAKGTRYTQHASRNKMPVTLNLIASFKMKTGQVAKAAGVNTETLRYYERRGLLPLPKRRPSGYREYASDAVTRIRFIKRAQELGFTLEEVRELLALQANPDEDRAAVKAKAEHKIADLQARIQDLERMKAALMDLTHACDGHGPVRDCPILHALEGIHP